MSSSIQESLSDMMKQIQKSLKNKENIDEIHKTPTKKGGGPFDFFKKYLDMVFSKEEQLKKTNRIHFNDLLKSKNNNKNKPNKTNKKERT